MKSPRIIVALLLCCALALARILGVHAHAAHEQPHAPTAHATATAQHEHGAVRVVSGFDDHADAHATGGDIDADAPDKHSGKLPSMVVLALVGAFVAFVLPVRLPTVWPLAYGAPPLRRRPHVFPPSQAPPLPG